MVIMKCFLVNLFMLLLWMENVESSGVKFWGQYPVNSNTNMLQHYIINYHQTSPRRFGGSSFYKFPQYQRRYVQTPNYYVNNGNPQTWQNNHQNIRTVQPQMALSNDVRLPGYKVMGYGANLRKRARRSIPTSENNVLPWQAVLQGKHNIHVAKPDFLYNFENDLKEMEGQNRLTNLFSSNEYNDYFDDFVFPDKGRMFNPFHDDDMFSDIFRHEYNHQLQHNTIQGLSNKDYNDLIEYLNDGAMDMSDFDEHMRHDLESLYGGGGDGFEDDLGSVENPDLHDGYLGATSIIPNSFPQLELAVEPKPRNPGLFDEPTDRPQGFIKMPLTPGFYPEPEASLPGLDHLDLFNGDGSTDDGGIYPDLNVVRPDQMYLEDDDTREDNLIVRGEDNSGEPSVLYHDLQADLHKDAVYLDFIEDKEADEEDSDLVHVGYGSAEDNLIEKSEDSGTNSDVRSYYGTKWETPKTLQTGWKKIVT